MKKVFIGFLCSIVFIICIVSIVVIGQEVMPPQDIKNFSINEFEFKGRPNCIMFIETWAGEKLECPLLPSQKAELMKVISDKITEMKLILERK